MDHQFALLSMMSRLKTFGVLSKKTVYLCVCQISQRQISCRCHGFAAMDVPHRIVVHYYYLLAIGDSGLAEDRKYIKEKASKCLCYR